MFRTINLFVVLPLLILGISTPAQAGAPSIANGSQPRDGIKHLQLEELWRAGGEDDELFFGLVAKVATDREGRVYILDSQTCQVHMYSPEGAWIRTLFREGEGPGEVRQARDMLIRGDGRIGVIQEIPGTVSYVWPDGTPAGRVQLTGPEGGVVNLTSCGGRDDLVLVAGNHSREGRAPEIRERVNCLERYDDEGQLIARYEKNVAEYDFADFHFREDDHLPPFWFSYDADSQGRIYSISNHTDYAINVHHADGRILHIITREYAQQKRPQDAVRRLERMVESAFNGVPFQPTIHINKTESPFAYFQRSLQVRDNGNLWALTALGARPEEPGVMAVFDVFDPEGQFIHQAALHAEHDGREVGIFLAGPDRILVVQGYMDSLAAQFGNGTAVADEGYEPQVPEVVCYRVK